MAKLGHPGKTYILFDENGNRTIIHNLRKYCRENILNYTAMNNLANNNPKHYMGMTVTHYTHDSAIQKVESYQVKKSSRKGNKTYKILTPTNKIVETRNLRDFCKERFISVNQMYKVSTGKLKHHEGYKIL